MQARTENAGPRGFVGEATGATNSSPMLPGTKQHTIDSVICLDSAGGDAMSNPGIFLMSSC